MKPEADISNMSESGRRCTLHVCTSCRTKGVPRGPKESRPGFILYQQPHDLLKDSTLKDHVDVVPAECLSICPRPCGIALSSNKAWTYLFGDQQPNQTAAEIMECISIYLQTTNGFMARSMRPKSLRGSILGRVPAEIRENQCI